MRRMQEASGSNTRNPLPTAVRMNTTAGGFFCSSVPQQPRIGPDVISTRSPARTFGTGSNAKPLAINLRKAAISSALTSISPRRLWRNHRRPGANGAHKRWAAVGFRNTYEGNNGNTSIFLRSLQLRHFGSVGRKVSMPRWTK